MTWEYQATVSDDIHRLVNAENESVWGVDHRGFDRDHPDALGTVDLDLPMGRASLLLVKPLPGGLVLDSVRSYQGLTEGELSTLFLGVFDELLGAEDPDSRLCLDCIGLDAEGRPRIIPGIHRTLSSSARRGLGEMLYHAAHGRPWCESLLPVNLALPEASPTLRRLIAELLDDSVEDGTLRSGVAEATAVLTSMGAPRALPLLPAESDLDPSQALTARLRAASTEATGHDAPARASTLVEPATVCAGGRSQPETEAGVVTTLRRRSQGRSDLRQAGQSQKREVSQKRGVSKRRRSGRHSRIAGDRSPLRGPIVTGMAGWVRHLAAPRNLGRLPPGRMRIPVLLALCLTIVGGVVMVRSWTSNGAPATQSASQEREARGEEREPGAGDAAPGASATGDPDPSESGTAAGSGIMTDLSDDEIFTVLDDLCTKRAEALSKGDSEGLRALTVPKSDAALADELVDIDAFAGNDYAIVLDGLEVVDRSPIRIVVRAQMSTTTRSEDDESGFEPRRVEFELAPDSGRWKVASVHDLEE